MPFTHSDAKVAGKHAFVQRVLELLTPGPDGPVLTDAVLVSAVETLKSAPIDQVGGITDELGALLKKFHDQGCRGTVRQLLVMVVVGLGTEVALKMASQAGLPDEASVDVVDEAHGDIVKRTGIDKPRATGVGLRRR